MDGRWPELSSRTLGNLGPKVTELTVKMWSGEGKGGIESVEKTMLMEERVIEMIAVVFATRIETLAARK